MALLPPPPPELDANNVAQPPSIDSFGGVSASFLDDGPIGLAPEGEQSRLGVMSDVRTSLFRALCEEDWAKVHDLLLTGKDTPVDYVNTKGNTMLHAAVQHGSPVNFLNALIQKGCPVNQPNMFGATALHFAAAFKADLNVFELLISKGADCDHHDSFGFTPLHVAVENNCIPNIIDLMLKNGGNPNSETTHGFTALHIAAEHSTSVAVFRMLNSHGGYVNKQTNKRSTPLDIAIGHHGPTSETVNILKEIGAKPGSELGWCCVIM